MPIQSINFCAKSFACLPVFAKSEFVRRAVLQYAAQLPSSPLPGEVKQENKSKEPRLEEVDV